MRKVRNWHRKRADLIARDFLPNELDDAIVVLGLLTEMLERAANSVDISDLSAIAVIFPP